MAWTDNNGFCVLSPYGHQAPCFAQRTFFCSHNPYNISTVICLFYKEVEREVKWLVQDRIISRQSKTSNLGVPDSRDVLLTSVLEPLVRN